MKKNNLIKKIYSLMGESDKRFFAILFLFSIVVSIVEILGVAAIMPFISVATDFDLIHEKWYFYFFYKTFGFSNPVNFVIVFGLVLSGFYIFRSVINYLYFHLLARFSKGRYYSIAIKLFQKYLDRSYRDYIASSKAELTKVLVSEGQNMTQVLSSLLFMMSEIIIIIIIYGVLLWLDWKITLLITLFLLINFIILFKLVSLKIKEAGKAREKYERDFFKIIHGVLGNFKIIKLSNSGEKYLNRFQQAIDRLSKSHILYDSLRELPRLYLESMGFIILIFIILYYIYITKSDITKYLPIVSVFVLALYRLLPSFHRIFGSYNHILYNYRAIEQIYDEMLYKSENYGDKPIIFKKGIQLKDIYFWYRPGKIVLNGISFNIRKGEKVGIIGESGSGKSTLVDILIGLYRPMKGSIYIDDIKLDENNIRSWRRKVGYIPQKIELMDGTVAENVALDDAYDEKKVKEVLKQASLLDFFEKEHEGIETPIGEDGIKLSGGQRQRIAIARALYHDPEVLVLDEATSALDMETEQEIMREIYSLKGGKTLVIVAHRLSTLEACDTIYHLKNGKIYRDEP
ncbi:ABC transporter ATP-binding protein [Nitratifractor salsuginis]|uniref:ABC transporter related protein n=1 Tax=Nitratifractor salsuginis (strain DSM 16511 / JCM 12458 / E9I37-1) TaxID=749222 RepID=E6X2V7_NITSE|nr:ABC transporter ATP-binding protein [Nitratifractor salsuginis]ADV47240.1 ABC transporter related protein [Nitratifractor salsuginis DSM 16511]